jgi:co-chaperonin GroES (HSP10)
LPVAALIPKRKIRLSEQDPLTFIPHGDRILVEMLEVDETTPSGIELPRMDDASKEHEVGWTAGVVVNVGSGHRMDVADQAVRMKAVITKEEAPTVPYLRSFDDETHDGIFMIPSTVPMPFARGMVIMLAKFAGSDIILAGIEHKVITQVHVLGVFTKLRLNVGLESATLEESPPERLLPLKVVTKPPTVNGEATAETYVGET